MPEQTKRPKLTKTETRDQTSNYLGLAKSSSPGPSSMLGELTAMMPYYVAIPGDTASNKTGPAQPPRRKQ